MKRIASLFITILVLSLQQGLQAQEVYRDNVVVVWDGSGSMGDRMRSDRRTTKMEAAKDALRKVADALSPNTNIGIVVFEADGVKDEWIYPLGPVNKTKLLEAINLPEPGGGTPLGAYIKVGADRLLAAREAQHGYGSYRLLVITDGEAGDDYLVDKNVPEVIGRGIIVDAIGVDMARDHTLATKVHSYRRADDPGSFTKVVQEVFAEVGGTTDINATREAFELLQGLPSEVGVAMIQAFSATGNHPIGERPKVSTNIALAQPSSADQAGVQSGISLGKVVLIGLGVVVAVAVLFLGAAIMTEQGY